MNKLVSPKIVVLTFGILVVCFAIAFYVVAWQEPTQAPPGGNVPAPLNVGNVGQSKVGGLILNTGGATNALIIDKGNLCFGTVDCRSSWPNDVDSIGSLSCHIVQQIGGSGSEGSASCDYGTVTGGGYSCGNRAPGGEEISKPSGNGWYCKIPCYGDMIIYAVCCRIQ